MTDRTTTSGTIVVSGTGRIAVEPDVADLRLGVSWRGPPWTLPGPMRPPP